MSKMRTAQAASAKEKPAAARRVSRSSTDKPTAQEVDNSFAAVFNSLKKKSRRERAQLLQRYFKTGPGEYGEGDRFLGLMVPQVRETLREFGVLPNREVVKLVQSSWHEVRLCGLLMWVTQFQKGNLRTQNQIFQLYLKNRKFINNWDLIDLTAPHIVGPFIEKLPQTWLDQMARSPVLWDRRIAVLATFYQIRQKNFGTALRLSERLLKDPEDLMHKAVGWMLREIGNRDETPLRNFLDQWATKMPRTMLRYAIERLPEKDRRAYLVNSRLPKGQRVR